MSSASPCAYITLHAAHRFKEARYGTPPCDKLPLHEVDELQEEMMSEALLAKIRAGAARHRAFGCIFVIQNGVVVTVIGGKRRLNPKTRRPVDRPGRRKPRRNG